MTASTNIRVVLKIQIKTNKWEDWASTTQYEWEADVAKLRKRYPEATFRVVEITTIVKPVE